MSEPICSQKTLKNIDALCAVDDVAGSLALAKDEHERRIAEQITLTQTPSAPFGEEARAEVFAELLKKSGLTEIKRDAIGNVIARIKGKAGGPVLVIGAHLDTVFPEGTDTKVRQEGSVYYAPGISDDSAGLACILQVARCLMPIKDRLLGDVVIVGTLGEEGNGDLRGVKALFAAKNDYDGMIAVDSANVHRILKGSVGCKRYRITFEGPGGHSLHKFGTTASAIHALARAITKVDELQVPSDPRCTFNFGVITGGTSVNAIAARAQAELDVRSFTQPALEAFIERIMKCLESSCEEENNRWGVTAENSVTLKVEQIGDRPAGINADDASVIQAAYGAQQKLGIELQKYTLAATDQNIPLFYGLPATTLGAGGTEANNHALTEEWDSTEAWLGPQLTFLTAVTLVGLEGVADPILEKRSHA